MTVATPAQWIHGARPRTLPAAIAPVIVGTAMAQWHGSFDPVRALLALIVAIALQVGVNYSNDYSDGIRGTDDLRPHTGGPVRLVGQQLAAPHQVKLAAFTCFGIAAATGLVLVILTGLWWLLLAGAAAIASAWFYTGGPKPYGYAGLGEVFVFIFFGVMAVVGTTYVQIEAMSWPALVLSVGVGAFACAILVANNLRDIPSDTHSGKRTLAVRLGAARTRQLYVALIGVGIAIPVVVSAIAGTINWPLFAGLGACSAFVLRNAMRSVLNGVTGKDLVTVLVTTGKGQLLSAVLTAIGIVLS